MLSDGSGQSQEATATGAHLSSVRVSCVSRTGASTARGRGKEEAHRAALRRACLNGEVRTVKGKNPVVDTRCRKSGRRDWGGAPHGGTDLIIHCMYYNSHMINNSLENSLCHQMPTLLPTANSQGSRTNCQLIWSSAVCCLAGQPQHSEAGRSSSGSHLPKRARIFQKER